VDDWRKERIARNESAFRHINERLNAGLRQIPHNPELLEFICECGNPTCEQRVRLSLAEYEHVRADSRHFAVAPGHSIPQTERVVASHARFEVVEKQGAAVELTDEADERTPGSTGRREAQP
jgi:hypothetical protein